MKKLISILMLFCSYASFGQAVYVNGFGATTASPSDPPSVINAEMGYGSWTLSAGSFTSFAGASGQALSMSSASATTNVWTLPLTVNSGYSLAMTSFSFWDRASATGYTNWQLDVNGTVVGSGTVSASGASTGTINISGAALTAVSNLTGPVNIHLTWSGGSHGSTGTGRLDNFTLNGTISVSGCTGTPATGTATASPTNICTGSSTLLTLSGASTGNGISYKWQDSTAGATWADISGATSTTYTTPTLSTTTYYQCITNCSSGFSNVSNTLAVNVSAPVAPSVTIAASTTSAVCSGTMVTYTATPVNGGTAPAYQWQLGGVNIPGATNATYSYAPANGNAITCVLTSNAACATPATATSNSITLTVNPSPNPTISGTTTITAGSSANLTFTGVAGDIITYSNGTTSSADTLSGTSSVVSVSPAVTTTYFITSATSANGCIQTITGQSATITVGSTNNTTPTRDDNMAMGNPSSATTDVSNSNNYLMIKSQYALSYNNSKGMANWVSWHLSAAWLDTTDRCNCFTEDAMLPSGYFRASTSDYTNTGFDRGHLCPSADRTGSDTDNAATFKMTNITPQSPNLNEGVWGQFEDYCRSLVAQGNELYIMAGGYGSGGTGSNGGTTTSIAAGDINVPDHFYKIVLVLPVGSNDVSRVTKSTTVIAVIMPNNQIASSHTWDYYRTTVDSIEGITGYNFLSNVPDSIQAVIESNPHAGPNTIAAWDFTGANSAATFAATTFDANLDATQDNVTRGATATASSGANSFRTQGFKNNGISTSNTDYFQTTIKAKPGYTVSLTTLSAAFQGTASFFATPGVTSQFAYSLNGSSYILIDTPITTTDLAINGIELSGIGALQNVPDSITVTLRYYASGQTTTGGWGFFSSSPGINGLAIVGSVDTVNPTGMRQAGTTGVPMIQKSGLHVTMQPNPATNAVTIKLTSGKMEHTTVRIADMAGRTVYYNDMGMQQNSSITIPLNNFAAGVYLTEVMSDGQRIVQKLVKE